MTEKQRDVRPLSAKTQISFAKHPKLEKPYVLMFFLFFKASVLMIFGDFQVFGGAGASKFFLFFSNEKTNVLSTMQK